MLLKTRMFLLLIIFLTVSCASKNKCDVDFKADFEFIQNNKGITKACLSQEGVIELRQIIRDIEKDGTK